MTHRQGANPPGADKEGKASLRLERAMESLPAESQPRLEPSGELDALAKAVIGAAIEVHRHLGPGYLESAYEEAMAIEFRLRGIPFERQAAVPIIYKGHDIGEGRVDFLVGKGLVVELKAVEAFGPVHKTQVISYLRAMRLHLGLLINFNVHVLKAGVQRVICS